MTRSPHVSGQLFLHPFPIAATTIFSRNPIYSINVIPHLHLRGAGRGGNRRPRVFSTVPESWGGEGGGGSNSFPGHRPAFFCARHGSPSPALPSPATSPPQVYEVNMRFAVAYDFNSTGAHIPGDSFADSQSSSDRNWITGFLRFSQRETDIHARQGEGEGGRKIYTDSIR